MYSISCIWMDCLIQNKSDGGPPGPPKGFSIAMLLCDSCAEQAAGLKDGAVVHVFWGMEDESDEGA